MFYELAKDKSLLNVLKKADLDEETSSLLNEGANVSLIKASLENNVTSQNMINYRKYITIAKNEEDDAKRRADERQSLEEGESDLTTDEELYNEEASREKRIAENLYGDAVSRQSEEKKAYKFLSNLEFQTGVLSELSTKINLQKKIVKKKRGGEKTILVVRGAMKQYLRLGATADQSGKLLSTLTQIKKNPNYLIEEYGSLLVNGVLTGKRYKVTRKGNDEERESASINVDDMTNTLNDILNLEYTIDDTTIDFIKAFEMLHVQQHTRLPKQLVPRSQVKDERIKMLRSAKKRGSTLGTDAEYERALRKIDAIRSNIRTVKNTITFLEEKIEELQEINKDKDKIVARKIQKVNRAIQTVVTSGKMKPEELKRLSDLFKDMTENKDKYVKEAQSELEREIRIEERELQRVKADLNEVKEDETISDFTKFLGMFRDSDPIESIKRQLIRGINTLSYLRNNSEKLAKLTAKSEIDLTQGFRGVLEDNPDIKMVDGYFEGLPTIMSEEIEEYERITDSYNNKLKQLQEIVNVIKNLIKGSE